MELSFFSSALALLLIISLYMSQVSATADTEFVKTSCNATTYPKLCFNTLSAYAGKIQASPKLLANTALNVTLSNAQCTFIIMTRVAKSPRLKPREALAMEDCVELMGDSIDMIRNSIVELGPDPGQDFAFRMSNVQTWVSAAWTDTVTCLDGFSGNEMGGYAKSNIQSPVLVVEHLISNALALVNNYANS
ncbi:Pectinesterase inhibitor domain [Dillenia turbinata]|uniref:pectinesterase n=1 Tax=Dillenia turbinata TaxID=194707 RepID=A0AAN8W9H4_9MAGN